MQDYEDDNRLDADSDFVEAWQDQIDDYREENPNDKRTNYELAVMFQEEEKEYGEELELC